MSADELEDGLRKVAAAFEAVEAALESAKADTDEAYQAFLQLGGSADLAYDVMQAVDGLLDTTLDLGSDLEGLHGAARAIGPSRTPEANRDTLTSLLDAVHQLSDGTAALMDGAERAASDARTQLRGSWAADNVGSKLANAVDELGEALAEIARLIDLANAEEQAYRGGSPGGAHDPHQSPPNRRSGAAASRDRSSAGLSWSRARIRPSGVQAVEQHLSRFERGASESAMVRRLQAILAGRMNATEFDLRFYTHELREAVLYRREGYASGQPRDPDEAYDLWDRLHTRALADYGITRRDAPMSLFHPTARP